MESAGKNCRCTIACRINAKKNADPRNAERRALLQSQAAVKDDICPPAGAGRRRSRRSEPKTAFFDDAILV
jgi:hypothetical protein